MRRSKFVSVVSGSAGARQGSDRPAVDRTAPDGVEAVDRAQADLIARGYAVPLDTEPSRISTTAQGDGGEARQWLDWCNAQTDSTD